MAESEARDNKVVYCPSCGKANPLGNRFCGNCGYPLPELVAAPAPAATTVVTPPIAPPPSATPPAMAAPVVTPVVPQAGSPVRPATIPAPPTAVKPAAPTADFPTATPPTPPANVAVPRDPIAREREREKLISEATRLRIKGMVTEARQTLERALAFTEGLSPQVVAPLYEQIGDLLDDEERIPEANAAYQKAVEIDPKRASAEKKLATLALRVASEKAENQLSDTLIYGDSLVGLLQSGGLRPHTGKRNAGVAMLMSMLIPGFGQFYNGQVRKGMIILAIFLLSLLLVAVMPSGAAVFGTVTSMFAMKAPRGETAPPLVWFIAFVGFATWLYAIVDAPFFAAKAGKEEDIVIARPTSKEGWDV